MTISEYFASNRDSNGRAWITRHCWIEQTAGRFHLNTPEGGFPFLGSDSLESAQSLTSRVGLPSDDDATDEWESDPAKPATVAQLLAEAAPPLDEDDEDGGDVLDLPEESVAQHRVADHFDDEYGAAAWPGPSVDDAESGDFEDSVGDLDSADAHDDESQDE